MDIPLIQHRHYQTNDPGWQGSWEAECVLTLHEQELMLQCESRILNEAFWMYVGCIRTRARNTRKNPMLLLSKFKGGGRDIFLERASQCQSSQSVSINSQAAFQMYVMYRSIVYFHRHKLHLVVVVVQKRLVFTISTAKVVFGRCRQGSLGNRAVNSLHVGLNDLFTTAQRASGVFTARSTLDSLGLTLVSSQQASQSTVSSVLNLTADNSNLVVHYNGAAGNMLSQSHLKMNVNQAYRQHRRQFHQWSLRQSALQSHPQA